jgi:hypothetical protein
MRYKQINHTDSTHIAIAVVIDIHDHDLGKMKIGKTDARHMFGLLKSEKLSDRIYALHKLSIMIESQGLYSSVTDVDMESQEAKNKS